MFRYRKFVAVLLSVGATCVYLSLVEPAVGQRISIGPGGISAGVGGYGSGIRVGIDHRGRYGYGYGPGYYYDRRGDYWYTDDGWDRWDYDDDRPAVDIGRGGADSTPPVPTAEELSYMNWKHLRRVLGYGAHTLADELDPIASGAGWMRHLQVDTILDAVADDTDMPPNAASNKLFRKLLAAYTDVDSNPEYISISRLWGFRTVRLALRELAKTPWVRQREQLAEASRELDKQLETLQTGDGWKRHLALPAEVYVSRDEARDDARGDGSAGAKMPKTDAGALRKVLSRFDKVSEDPQYGTIARLPAFQATHEILAVYLSHFVAPPAAPGPPTE